MIGPLTGGALALLVWAVAAVVAAVVIRQRRLVALHVTVAVGLVLAVVSISRIFGTLWWYLTLWVWGLAAVAALATAWTIAVRVHIASADPKRTRQVTAGLMAAVVVVSCWFAVEASTPEVPAARLSAALGAVLPGTIEALDGGVAGATGKRGTYVVAWSDAAQIGSQAYGLVNELERRGYRAGMTSGLHVPLTDSRVIDPSTATAEIQFATGAYIAAFRAKPGAVEVASADLRSPAERAEFARLRTRLLHELPALGRDDLARLLDLNLFAVSIDDGIPRATKARVDRMLELGEPVVVFLAPPGTSV